MFLQCKLVMYKMIRFECLLLLNLVKKKTKNTPIKQSCSLVCNTDHSGLKEAEILSGTFKKKKRKNSTNLSTSSYCLTLDLKLHFSSLSFHYRGMYVCCIRCRCDSWHSSHLHHTHTHTHTHVSSLHSWLGPELASLLLQLSPISPIKLQSAKGKKKKKRGHFPLLTCSVDSPLTSHLSSLSLSLTGSPSLPLMQTSFFFSSSFFFKRLVACRHFAPEQLE